MALPPSFIDLASAYDKPDGAFVNIIGIVTDFMAPKIIPRTGQYVFTCVLLDCSFQDAHPDIPGVTVRFFHFDTQKFPKVQNRGDVVLLRAVKMSTFAGQKLAMGNFSTGSLCFYASAIPSPGFQIAFNDKKRLDCQGAPIDVAKFTLVEQAYVIDLKQALSATIQEVAAKQAKRDNAEAVPSAAPPSKKLKSSDDSLGQKFRLVRELKDRTFVDVIGQVVKCFPVLNGNCDLYITDYTENEQMFHYPAPGEETEGARDGDTFGYSGPPRKAWPGPYGYMILKINARPPHAQYANTNVKPGDIVLLRNVKCKIQFTGHRLEGDMWPDDLYPARVQIRKMRTTELPAVQNLLRRKESYWKTFKAKGGAEQESKERLPKPAKLQGMESKNNQSLDMASETMSKKAIKKAKSKLKKQKQEERSKVRTETEITVSEPDRHIHIESKSGLNRHVRCSHDNVRMVSIKDILDPDNARHTALLPDGRTFHVPFVNAKYRTKVRVVDFAPKSLRDFSVPAPSTDDDISDSMDWAIKDTQRFEWSFRLQLEDANSSKPQLDAVHSRLWVDVGHEHAQFLLGNSMDDPKDLKSDARLLANLRERMFVLWGNLEENGGQELSNLCFECCIMEYGIKMDEDGEGNPPQPMGWKRIYSMFGTTIL